MENKDWNKAIDGVINVPDELDYLVNKVGMQFKFVKYSSKNEAQAVCDIVRGCEEFFTQNKSEKTVDDEEINNKYPITGALHGEEGLYKLTNNASREGAKWMRDQLNKQP